MGHTAHCKTSSHRNGLNPLVFPIRVTGDGGLTVEKLRPTSRNSYCGGAGVVVVVVVSFCICSGGGAVVVVVVSDCFTL